ncbi:hypothetical protein [Anaerosporobacter sp.]
MLTIAIDRCKYLPDNIEDISKLLENLSDGDKAMYYLEQLTENVTKFITKYRLLP